MVKAVAIIPSTSAHEMLRESVEADTVNPSGGKIVGIVVLGEYSYSKRKSHIYLPGVSTLILVAGPVPALLTAATLMVYKVLEFNPDTVADLASPSLTSTALSSPPLALAIIL